MYTNCISIGCSLLESATDLIREERSSIDFEIISAGHLPHDENPEAVNKARIAVALWRVLKGFQKDRNNGW